MAQSSSQTAAPVEYYTVTTKSPAIARELIKILKEDGLKAHANGDGSPSALDIEFTNFPERVVNSAERIIADYQIHDIIKFDEGKERAIKYD